MIDHNIDVQSVSSRAPKVVRKCESYTVLVFLWCGRTVARAGGRSVVVRSRDCQNFWEWVDFLSYGAPPTHALRGGVELRYKRLV